MRTLPTCDASQSTRTQDEKNLGGRVLDHRGDPIRNALAEIWQADHTGIYLHTQDALSKRDANFQGFGRFLTGATGNYYFRTIKPVAYRGRTRHIHVAVKMKGHKKWTTEWFDIVMGFTPKV